MTDWKKVAANRLRTIRAWERSWESFEPMLREDLERALLVALHSRCVGNVAELSKMIADDVVSRDLRWKLPC